MTFQNKIDWCLSRVHESYGISIYYKRVSTSALVFEQWFEKSAKCMSPNNLARPCGNVQAIPSLCYANARFNMLNHDFQYYEGFYWIPERLGTNPAVPHAYNAKSDNELYDFTILGNDHIINPEFYYGVSVPREIVIQLIKHYEKLDNRIAENEIQLSLLIPYFYFGRGEVHLLNRHHYQISVE